MQDLQNLSKTSYQNYIALAILLMAIYALVFFAMRVGISVFAFEDFGSLRGDFIKIYLSGLKLDLSDFAIGASLFLLLGYLSSAFALLPAPKAHIAPPSGHLLRLQIDSSIDSRLFLPR